MSEKTALRAQLRGLRKKLAAQAPGAAEAAAAALPLDRLPAFQSFSLYQPMGSELDPRPLWAVLSRHGAQGSLPLAADRDTVLEFRAWSPGDALEADAFRIPAPIPEAAIVLPDIVIAPVLGFDAHGNRLGQGAGHYDRTLDALRRIKPVFVVGLAYAGQHVGRLPDEPHDQPLDAILTEAGYHSFA